MMGTDDATSGDKTGYEYTAAYVCPMHCEGSGSEEPGKCSVCGMDMEKNEDSAKSEEGHEHEGHDHDHGDHDEDHSHE